VNNNNGNNAISLEASRIQDRTTILWLLLVNCQFLNPGLNLLL